MSTRAVAGRPDEPAAAREEAVASQHTVADDIVYDLVSVQYHALKGSQLYGRFLQDAQHAGEHREVAQFFEACKREDDERARRCHELLGQLTGNGQGIH